MLKGINGNVLTITCNNCKSENNFDVLKMKSTFSVEDNEYENLSFSCPGCQSVEIFNMNIPVDDTEERFSTGDLPQNEEIQRYYVRLLIRMTRADFNQ